MSKHSINNHFELGFSCGKIELAIQWSLSAFHIFDMARNVRTTFAFSIDIFILMQLQQHNTTITTKINANQINLVTKIAAVRMYVFGLSCNRVPLWFERVIVLNFKSNWQSKESLYLVSMWINLGILHFISLLNFYSINPTSIQMIWMRHFIPRYILFDKFVWFLSIFVFIRVHLLLNWLSSKTIHIQRDLNFEAVCTKSIQLQRGCTVWFPVHITCSFIWFVNAFKLKFFGWWKNVRFFLC